MERWSSHYRESLNSFLRDSFVTQNPNKRQEQLSKYRWVVLGTWCFANAAMQLTWNAIPSAQSAAKDLYGINSDEIINLLTDLFYILYVPGSLFFVYIIGKSNGLFLSLLIGTIALAVAAWLRVLSAYCDIVALQWVGGVIAGLGQPLIMNVAAQLAASWMGRKEQTVAIMLGENAISMVAPAIADLFVGGVTANNFPQYMLWLAVIASVALVTVALFVKSKPKVPVQPTDHDEHQEPGFLESFSLFKHTSFMLILVAFSLEMAIMLAFSTVIPDFMDKYDYSGSDVTTTLSAGTFGAVFAAIVFAFLNDYLVNAKGFAYSLVLMGILSITTLGGCVLMLIVMGPGAWLGITVAQVLIVAGAWAFLPIAINLAAQATGIHGASAGFLLMVGNLAGFVLSIIVPLLKVDGSYTVSLILCIALAGMGVVMVGMIWLNLRIYLRDISVEDLENGSPKRKSLGSNVDLSSAADGRKSSSHFMSIVTPDGPFEQGHNLTRRTSSGEEL